MNLIIAQFFHIEPSSKSFNRYLSEAFKAQKGRIELVVLGDYVANRFFKEYRSKTSIPRECEAFKKYFSALAKKHKTTIIAPLFECENGKIFKSILVATATKTRFYRAFKLMNFAHWNEASFFDNDSRKFNPLIFEVAGLKASVIFGWEAHFDEITLALKKKNIDMLIIPTSSTFSSNLRWMHLLQMRSFLNSCFVVRVNRTGSYVEDNIAWDFYGESFISLPDGTLGDMLDTKEGILVSEISTDLLHSQKDIWRFR